MNAFPLLRSGCEEKRKDDSLRSTYVVVYTYLGLLIEATKREKSEGFLMLHTGVYSKSDRDIEKVNSNCKQTYP